MVQENFELETILTIMTGIKFTEDFQKVYDLAWFVYDDSFINESGLRLLRQNLMEHLLTIHPKLKEIESVPKLKFKKNSWLLNQKIKFGISLPVSKIGAQLKKEQLVLVKVK